jgi:hypothetical protein
MSTVREVHKTLSQLIEAGHGGVELISRDCRSGDTGSVSASQTVEECDGEEGMGRLCDEPKGFQYVEIYVEH